MRIVMIGQKGAPMRFGGIESYVEELSRELVRKGHEVFVFCRSWYTPKTTREHQGIQLVHTPSINTKHLDAITHTFTSLFAAMRLKPDVVHIHGVGPALLSWLPRLIMPRAYVVVTFHCIDRKHAKWGTFARLMLRLGEWAACRFADRTVTVGKNLHAYCLAAYETPTEYIPVGVPEANVFDDTVLAELGLEKKSFAISVGRFVAHKNVHTAIEAWQAARRLRPELLRDKKFVIVGNTAFTDEYTASLFELAKGDASIVFASYVEPAALASLLRASAFFINPSASEGLPKATIEAMMAGVPIVASDIAENLEVVAEHGLVFPVGNSQALRDLIVWSFMNPELLASRGQAGQMMVKTNFRLASMVAKMETLYASLATEHHERLPSRA